MLTNVLGKKGRFQWGLLGICILFSFVLYAPILNSYFIAEDTQRLTYHWSEINNEFFGIGQTLGYRPGTTVYHVINNMLWGRNPVGHHATAVFIHALTGWLVGLFALRVTKNESKAGIAALLFASSPAHAEAVGWISAAAGTVTSTFICMLALSLWTKLDRSPDALTIGLVTFLYLIALLTKEIAGLLPGMLMVIDWFMGRRFTVWQTKEIFRSFLFYWPFYAALGVFALLYWNSGALEDAVAYGTPAGISILLFIARLSLSLRFMFLPIGNFIDVGSGIGNLVWLLLFVILIGLSRARWTFVLTLVALIPSLFSTGGRMAYMPMVGFSMGLASLLFDGTYGLSNRINPKLINPFLAGMVGILLLGFGIGVYRELVPVIKAGEVIWSIPRQVKDQVPELPPKSEIYFIGFPDELIYRWGIIYEVRYLYDDPTLTTYSIENGPPVGLTDKIPLDTIPCESSQARYFFKYDAHSKVLSQVGEKEFGLVCP